MDLMEQLLCPQVCMDIEDTPITIENPSKIPDIPPEADASSLNEELRVRMILDGQFEFNPEQIPHDLLDIEKYRLKSIYHFEFLEKAKIHCTVCMKHIGTAPVAQFDRYIHPELNILLCHACYKFYGSGEFEKDEDGSEIYCKWCAQGGTVMCCSECPLVFCQICVRKNLGPSTVSKIKSSDTWKCFKCVPEQLSNFHILCHVLHDYTKQQMTTAIAKENMPMLKLDISTCCKSSKRKRKVTSDDENDEFLPNKQKQKNVKKLEPFHRQNKSLPNTSSQIQANTLFQNLELQAVRQSAGGSEPLIKFVIAKKGVTPGTPTLASLMPKLLPRLTTTSSTPSTSSANTSMPKLAPITRQPVSTQGVKQSVTIKHRPTSTRTPNASSISQQQAIRIAWLVNSISESKINVNSLLRAANEIQIKARAVSAYGELATLHNKMQHAIAQCAHSLIETRKNMHKEFLKYLNRMNVNHTSYSRNGSVVKTPLSGKADGSTSNSTTVKINNRSLLGSAKNDDVGRPITAEIDLCDDDDDDGEIDEYPIPTERDPLTITDDEDDEHADVDYDMLRPEVILSDGSRVVDVDFNDKEAKHGANKNDSGEVTLINSDDDLDETHDTASTADSRKSDGIQQKPQLKEDTLSLNEDNSIIDNDLEDRETPDCEKDSEVQFDSTEDDNEDSNSLKSIRRPRKKRKKTAVFIDKDETSIPSKETNEMSQSIDFEICASTTDDGDHNASEIVDDGLISKNLLTKFTNIYKECVSANAKACYDLSELSYEEFMRAISVKIILNHPNPKLRVEAVPTSKRSIPFPDLANTTKDCPKKTVEDSNICKELDSVQEDTCSSAQYESSSTNEPAEDTSSTSQHDDSSTSDQEEKDTSELIKKSSFDFVQQMQNENSQSGATGSPGSSLTPDEHNFVDSTVEHLNTLMPQRDTLPITQNAEKDLSTKSSVLSNPHDNQQQSHFGCETVALNASTSLPIVDPLSTDVPTVIPSIPRNISAVSTSLQPVTTIPSAFATAVPRISPAIVPTVSPSTTNIPQHSPTSSSNIIPPLAANPTRSHSVPEYPQPVFNHSLHPLQQPYTNSMQPGSTFNNSALPLRETYSEPPRQTFNDRSPMPQQSFNSPLHLQSSYNRIPQPQIYNNPAQHQASAYNNSSPVHSPYNTPPQNYALYNNPEIRSSFNNPHSPFNPTHSSYNNPSPSFNSAYNPHSSYNTPPPFNSPSHHPTPHFSNHPQSQPPYHPINIPQPPLSFNNPTYIPPQRPLASNEYPVATTTSSDFNEGGSRANTSGTNALDTTPPAICLEDMIKIYEACDTTIDGDMVPTDE